MNDRQKDLFDRAIEGHRGLHWQLRLRQGVDSIAEDIVIPETDNWQDDFERTLDEVDRIVRTLNVSALEIVSDHQEKSGDNDSRMIDEIIAHFSAKK